MTTRSTKTSTEAEARQVAEESRETEWSAPSFLKELFLGNFRLDLVHPFPDAPPERPVFRAFYERMRRFLANEVDSDEIDRDGQIPQNIIDQLAAMGAFGMKIPVEYGGLGLTQREYCEVIKLVTSQDGNLVALLSAHQSIGVPQPVKLFGTDAQKAKYLPRCARGAVSAFALTERDVGSDPGNLTTTAERTEGGDYILNGEKLWCTNGTIAELYVVMARHPDTGKISAFIVERDWPGVEVAHRCRFMGLRAIENGYSLVRVDYNGTSAVFDPMGRIVARQDTTTGGAHMMMADVQVSGTATLYGRVGDLFAWLCVLFSGVLVAFARRRYRV